EDRDTPLHFAAKRGETEIVRALLKAGAEADPVDEDNETPLFLAAEEGHGEVVQALLQAPGVQPDRRNNDGVTAAQAARNHGYGGIADMIDHRVTMPIPMTPTPPAPTPHPAPPTPPPPPH